MNWIFIPIKIQKGFYDNDLEEIFLINSLPKNRLLLLLIESNEKYSMKNLLFFYWKCELLSSTRESYNFCPFKWIIYGRSM